MKYRHLFFDLDHTLWDFEQNSRFTLLRLYEDFKLAEFNKFGPEDFYKKYKFINQQFWRLFALGKVNQQELRTGRFEQTFLKLGLKRNQIPAGISEAYTDLCPQQAAVFPHTHDTLAYLKGKYTLHIITNGFPEIQAVKMQSAGISGFFSEIITSACIDCQKPDRRIFRHALERSGATAPQSLMIGDNLEADVLGAKAAGLDQVFFNPEKHRHKHKPTYEIQCLSKLQELL